MYILRIQLIVVSDCLLWVPSLSQHIWSLTVTDLGGTNTIAVRSLPLREPIFVAEDEPLIGLLGRLRESRAFVGKRAAGLLDPIA